MGTIYESSVVYFGKVTSRQAVLEDKRRFVERWPQRSYTKGRELSSSSAMDRLLDARFPE